METTLSGKIRKFKSINWLQILKLYCNWLLIDMGSSRRVPISQLMINQLAKMLYKITILISSIFKVVRGGGGG